MSVFYLLPPRPFLADHFAAYAGSLFPGLEWSSDHCADLVTALGDAVSGRPDTFVVYREELPEGDDALQALADGFGAEVGDEVIEIRPGPRAGELAVRRCRLGQAA